MMAGLLRGASVPMADSPSTTDVAPSASPSGPAAPEPAIEPRLLPRIRAMLGIAFTVCGMAWGSEIVEPMTSPWPPGLAGLVLLLGLVAVRGAPSAQRTTWVGAISLATAVLLELGAGRFAGVAGLVPLLALVIALATAAFVPWGLPPQIVVTLALGAGVIRHATFVGPAPSAAMLLVTVVGFGLAIVLSYRGHRFQAQVRASAASLQVTEASLRELTDVMSDVSWMTSPDGRTVLYVSPAYDAVWGRSRTLLEDHPEDWLNAVHSDDRSRVARALADVAGGGRYDEEYRIVRPDGGIRWVHSRGRPIRDDAGRIKAIAGLAEDITDRRAAEEARMLRGLAAHLQQAREDERRRLARRLHDDLAQHMTAIGLGVSWLARKVPPGPDGLEPQLRDIAGLVESTVRMLRGVIAELRPTELDDFGLTEAVRWQAREFESRTGVPCAVIVPETGAPCGHECRVGAFRIFQELLAHAGGVDGVQHVEAAVREDDDTIVLAVDVSTSAAVTPAPSGIATLTVVAIRERAHMLGGEVTADAPCLHVEVRIPAHR